MRLRGPRRRATTRSTSRTRANCAKAAHAAQQLGRTAPPSGPETLSGAWSSIGPSPVLQIQRSDSASDFESGRIGAPAIRPGSGELVLGVAQGGLWRADLMHRVMGFFGSWAVRGGAARSPG